MCRGCVTQARVLHHFPGIPSGTQPWLRGEDTLANPSSSGCQRFPESPPNKSLTHGFWSQRLLLWERRPRQGAVPLEPLLRATNSAGPPETHASLLPPERNGCGGHFTLIRFREETATQSGHRVCAVGGVEGRPHPPPRVCLHPKPMFRPSPSRNTGSFSGRVCRRGSRFTRSFGTKAQCLAWGVLGRHSRTLKV